MKFLYFLLIIGSLEVSSLMAGVLEDALVERYQNPVRSGTLPLVGSGILFVDGGMAFRSSGLESAILVCFEEGEVNRVDILRGIYHGKDYVRFACIWFLEAKFGDLEGYPMHHWKFDPFVDEHAWESASKLRLFASETEWPQPNG